MARAMPWSVRIAAAAQTFVLVALVSLVVVFARQGRVPWVQSAIAIAVLAAILVGLVRGARLAWQWGRAVGFLLSALVFASAAIAAWRVLPRRVLAEDGFLAAAAATGWFLPLLVPVLGLGVPLVIVAVALGRPSAYAWFSLTCPHCGATAPRAADLRFRSARCRSCGELY